MNNISTILPEKTFFKVQEGSNYKITLINRKAYVVEYEQFLKIAKKLNTDGVMFISLNDSIVNKNRIESIEPTKEETPNEILERETKATEMSDPSYWQQ